jgi:hypothetical protein
MALGEDAGEGACDGCASGRAHAALLRNNAETGRSNAAITSAAEQSRDQHFSNSRSPGVFQSTDKLKCVP